MASVHLDINKKKIGVAKYTCTKHNTFSRKDSSQIGFEQLRVVALFDSNNLDRDSLTRQKTVTIW